MENRVIYNVKVNEDSKYIVCSRVILLSGNKLEYRKNPVFMRVCGVQTSLLITI